MHTKHRQEYLPFMYTYKQFNIMITYCMQNKCAQSIESDTVSFPDNATKNTSKKAVITE